MWLRNICYLVLNQGLQIPHPVVSAALITTHSIVHALYHSVAPAAKVKKVELFCILSIETMEN